MFGQSPESAEEAGATQVDLISCSSHLLNTIRKNLYRSLFPGVFGKISVCISTSDSFFVIAKLLLDLYSYFRFRVSSNTCVSSAEICNRWRLLEISDRKV